MANYIRTKKGNLRFIHCGKIFMVLVEINNNILYTPCGRIGANWTETKKKFLVSIK